MARVFVEPIGVTLEVAADEDLLAPLVRAAVDIPTDCAGRGTCGKCLVRLGAGELTPPTERELKRVPEKLRARRLAPGLPGARGVGARQHRGARHRRAAAHPHGVQAAARRGPPGRDDTGGDHGRADDGGQALGRGALHAGAERRRHQGERRRRASARAPAPAEDAARRPLARCGGALRAARRGRVPGRVDAGPVRRRRRHRHLQGHRLPVRPRPRPADRPGGRGEPADALRRGRHHPHRARGQARPAGAAAARRDGGHQHDPRRAL